MPSVGAFYTSTLPERIIPKVSDNVIQRSDLLKTLDAKGCIEYNKGGDGFDFRVRNSESAIGGATSDWGQRNFSTTQPFTTITDTYRQYTWNMAVSLFQMDRNQNADKTSKMFDMADQQLKELRQSATSRLATHAYGSATSSATTGDVATPINGLEDIVSDSNTFEGVDRSTTTGAYFRAQIVNVTTFTGDQNSIGVNDGIVGMDNLYLSASRGKQVGDDISDTVAVDKDAPDFVLTTAALWRAYKNSLGPQFRFADKNADYGKTIKYNEMDVTWDDYCTAGRMYMLNSRHMTFRVVNDKLLTVLHQDKGFNPPAMLYLIGGQFQLFSDAPRYLGALRVTNV